MGQGKSAVDDVGKCFLALEEIDDMMLGGGGSEVGGGETEKAHCQQHLVV